MDTPILIGIHGAKGTGKDTTARFVKEWAEASEPVLSAVRRGFADKPKWAFARQFMPDITQEEALKWVDDFKNTHHSIWYPFGKNLKEVQFRQALDQFATESAREIYGQDFWTDQLLPKGEDRIWKGMPLWHTNFLVKLDENTAGPADFCLIPDLRVEDEVQRIKALGGLCWKVRRKDAENAVHEEFRKLGREPHLFHQDLPDELFDVIFVNDDNDMLRSQQRVNNVLALMSEGKLDRKLVMK
jgi:hypothetical protein